MGLLAGYEVIGDGRFIVGDLRIHYRVGGRRYVSEVPPTLTLCTPQAQTSRGTCPLPDDL
ncbi:MAG: hypothetical protein ACR2MA_00745 [Egibacteraceae bacterium]